MINTIPEGPLKYFVRRIQIPPLSVFQSQNYYPRCGLALTTFRNRCIDFANIDRNNDGFMIPDEIPDLFLFLSDNEYVIDTNITTMMSFSEVKLTNRNIICFFKYIGEENI